MPKIEIEGLDKLTKKRFRDTDWMADAITKGMRQSGLAIQKEAVILAPVNTGALRQSITPEVDERPPFALWTTVGPTVGYGKYVEFGRSAGTMGTPEVERGSACVFQGRLSHRSTHWRERNQGPTIPTSSNEESSDFH